MTFRTNRSLTLDRVSRRSILAADAGGLTAVAARASSTAVRRFGVAALAAGLACGLLPGGAVMADQVLDIHNASLTTYLPTSPTNVQNISPIVLQRGVHLDGTLRHGPTWPMALAGNPSGESWNSRLMMSGLRLDTGTYSQVHVDLSLPTDGHAVVIARTYNARQVDDSSHHDSNGYQGRNWFQMAQPEIILYDADSNPATLEVEDVLYLVYGADRFIEFRRIDDASEEFRATNGAAGGMKRTAAAGGEPETYAFTDQVGNQFVFFGFDNNAAPAEGQFWKAITPKHPSGSWVTFVGDADTASTAIANGFTASGQVEFMYDASDRRFTFTYTTYDSVSRLTQVKAQTKSGGTWASPTGVIEVGKVDYDYYRSTGNTTYGDNGCLERVTVTLPLTDSGISSVTNTYYRYWKGAFDDSTNPGYPYALQYIVDREGTRRFDWADEDMTDADYETASEGILKPYAAAYFEYDSSHRVDKGWFNGECGCSGAANGEHAFEYEVNGSYTDTSGYTDAWTRRTTINRPDSGWEVFYFDEAGQPLHWILADGDPDNTGPAPNFWVTEVDRNSAGQLIEIRTPAANASYTHSTATFSANASAGLITVFTRVSSGNLTGLLETIKHKKGTSGTAFYDQKLTYTSQDKAISGSVPTVTITRPAVSGRTIYESETSSDTGGLTTSVTYTWYTGELIPKMVLTTSPAVTTAKNGSNTATTSAVYLRRDGTVAFSEAQDGIFAYTAYTKRQVTTRVEDVITNGSFPSGDDPNTDWSITETGNGSNRTTTMTYDAQGRLDVTTLPDGRLTKQYYTKLQSERLITLSIPRYTTATPTYYGPVGYSVSNHAGRGEFSGSIALSGGSTTSALTGWIDEADATFKDDPIKAVDVGTVTRMATSIYDESGTKLEESRSYFDLPASGAGTVGTHYDATAYTYDVMGRTETVTDPTGTIRLTVFDAIGRVSSHTIGTVNGGGGDNMVTTDLVVYDAGGVGNSFVTTRTARVQSGTTDQRTTTYEYDVRGRLMVVNNATAPHVLNKYDNLGRLVATGLYSSDSGLDEADDPTTLATNRMALSQTLYDERGMVYRTQRHKIDDADGSDDSSLASDTWYDAPGRVIKTVGGQVTKTFYDRLGRQTHQFILAKAFNSGGSGETLYADADDVAYDIVMEEHRTTYESMNSDNVIMSAVIARHHDDKDTGETVGALDTNADTDDLLYTAANLEGRIQITATWFDDLDRVTTTAFYGTNGGGNFDRDGLSIPTRSDTILVTSYVYNDDGTLLSVTDPEARETRFVYDDLGRQVTVINNYINGTPSSETGDDDLFTRYVFEDGLQRKMWVDIDGDGTEDAEDQVTTYTYGVTTGQTPASTITVNHLLREVKYPDSGGASDVVVYAYNAQGQTLAMKDQAGNVHEYIFDLSGRQTIDKATTIATGAGFDDAVKRIETAYDTLGRVSTITQYDATTSGTALDQVKTTYDDWGNVAAFRQDRNGLVDAGGSVDDYQVSYTYTRRANAGERQTVRVNEVTLPSGKIVTMVYSPNNGRHDQELSRVTIVREELGANDVNLVRYEYLGVGHVVGTEYLESSVYSRVYSGSPATYDQLDRFNRITSSRWVKDLTTDRTFYQVDLSYDRNSNITWAEDAIHTGFDVKYTLDDLNRLVMAEEGTESSGSIASRTRQELWTLTQTGNWELFKRDINGNNTFSDSGDFNDDRTHNVVNELTARDIDDNGSDNYTLTYDATGNLTNDGENYKYIYDAWYRLRKVLDSTNGDALVAELTYYGTNHRKGHHYDVDGDGTVEDTADDPWVSFAWNERWQLVATFEGSTSTPAEEWVLHQAGLDGRGGGSYIDDVILRDRDTDGNGSLDERLYLCQNWRHDLSAVVTDTGKMVEWVKYSSYGEPLALPAGDTDSDGDWDATDSGNIAGGYDVRKDAELDGDVDASDITHANSITGGYQTLGRTVLSSTAVNNRKGYAGYERDHSIPVLYHIRHRVLHTTLGRWTRRDPLGYVDGVGLYEYASSSPADSVDPMGENACTESLLECLNDREMKWINDHVKKACKDRYPKINCCRGGQAPPPGSTWNPCVADHTKFGVGSARLCGAFNDVTMEICICTRGWFTQPHDPLPPGDKIDGCADGCRTLREELIHAWQICTGFPIENPTRVQEHICAEIGARGGSKERTCKSVCSNYHRYLDITYDECYRMCGELWPQCGTFRPPDVPKRERIPRAPSSPGMIPPLDREWPGGPRMEVPF